MTCPKCAQVMCLACGEEVRETSEKRKGGHVKTNREQKLLHCPNLQVSMSGGFVQNPELWLNYRVYWLAWVYT
jgi:hypothetical protein